MGSLSEFQQQLILGSVLGDGYMRKKTNAHLQITHSIKQKEYVDWKYGVLRNLILTPPKPYKGNGNRIGYRFFTRSLPEITFIYDIFYRNKVKIVPSVLKLTPISLAVWYMDDGSKSGGSCYFNTQQFDVTSQVNLLKSLDKLGIKASLNRDKEYLRIRVFSLSTSLLSDLIQPYVIASMQYKIPV